MNPTTLQHDFEERFLRSDGLMDKYVYKENPESETGYDVTTTGEAILAFIEQKCAEAYKKGEQDYADRVRADLIKKGGVTFESVMTVLEAARGDSTTV